MTLLKFFLVVLISVSTSICFIQLSRHIPTPSLGVTAKIVRSPTKNDRPPNGDFAIEKNTLNAVVHVRAISHEREEGTFYGEAKVGGSGVLITEDGFLITNYHVVKNTSSITVTRNNNRLYPATVIGFDAANDIAVLKIGAHDLPFLSIGNSDEMRIGQWVLAVGYPLTLDQTTTAGIVSALPRLTGNIPASYALDNYIQTDAAINLGNSGGALLDTRGQLIGINAAIVSPNKAYTGYGFAIPANVVKASVAKIIDAYHKNL